MSDAAVTTIVSGAITLGTMLIGFLTLWIKLKYGVEQGSALAIRTKRVEDKLDDNTALTEAGTRAAADSAKVAAYTASEAKDAATRVAEQLNGKLEDRILLIVKAQIEPIMAVIRSHADQDDRNMAEIRGVLGELRSRVK